MADPIKTSFEDLENGDEKDGLLKKDEEKKVVVPSVPALPPSMVGFSFASTSWCQKIYLLCCIPFCLLVIHLKCAYRHSGGKTGFGSISDTYCFLSFVMMLVLYPESQSETPPAKKPAPPKEMTAPTDAPKKVAAKPRLLYLDNIKILLTLLVVKFHVSNGFGGFYQMPYGPTIGNYQENNIGMLLSIWNIWDQGYFMCLFFFISGYFTPSSLQRKGIYAFLKDKFMRFGIPMTLGLFIGYPIYKYSSMAAAFGTDWNWTAWKDVNFSDRGSFWWNRDISDGKNYAWSKLSWEKWFDVWFLPAEGPLWFLQALLCFNLTFCLVFPKGLENLSGNIPLPKFSDCLLLGSLFGIIQKNMLWVVVNNNKPSLGFMNLFAIPMSSAGGTIPFDILFFFAGAVAKKNEWLEQLVSVSTPSLPTETHHEKYEKASKWRTIFGVRIYSLFLLIIFVFMARSNDVTYDPTAARLPFLPPMVDTAACQEFNLPKDKYPPKPPTPVYTRDENDWKHYIYDQTLNGNSYFWHILRGQYTICMAYAMLQFFGQYFNEDAGTGWYGRMKGAMGEASYGVYLFHWILWPIVFRWCIYLFGGFLLKMRLDGEPVVEKLNFVDCGPGKPFTSSNNIGDVAVFGLWFSTLFIVNLILWPGCYYLRKIPGFDQVL